MRLMSLSILVLISVLFMGLAPVAMAEKVFDPVCKIKIEEEDDTTIQAEYDGKVYSFCSEECFDQFKAYPDNYACACPPESEVCAHCGGSEARCKCTVESCRCGSEESEGHKHH